MALMFDISILLLIYIGLQFVLPNVIQSDYTDIRDKISHQSDVESKANDKADSAASKASTASDKRKAALKKGDQATADAQQEKAQAQRQIEKTQKAVAKKASTKQDDLAKDIQGTTLIVTTITFFVFLLYLVPMTALTGQTLGMRRTKIRCVRIDGTPAGWIAVVRPLRVPIAIRALRPAARPGPGSRARALGLPDRNKQGIHDKLARPSWSTTNSDERDRFSCVTCSPSRRARRSRSTCSAARARTSPR